VVVLGSGTGVGKTHLSRALARALRGRVGRPGVVALKPIETGTPWSDAGSLQAENAFHVEPHPLFALEPPISPHLAARRAGVEIRVDEVRSWVEAHEAQLALSDNMLPHMFSLVETAGGAFSPLSLTTRNIELATALEPALFVVVAPDALGVLHSMSVLLTAMERVARAPDFVVLSAATRDESTGTNAAELRALGIADPTVVLGPGEDDASALADALLARAAVSG
jgi:dethiobiotin synthetase